MCRQRQGLFKVVFGIAAIVFQAPAQPIIEPGRVNGDNAHTGIP